MKSFKITRFNSLDEEDSEKLPELLNLNDKLSSVVLLIDGIISLII
jgi:hypothetical protein